MRPASRPVPRSLVLAACLACAPTSMPPTETPTAVAEPEPTPVEVAPVEPAAPAVPVTERDAASDALWTALATPHTIPRKVVIGKYGAVRFAADGDVVADGGDAPAFEDVPVVEVKDDRIRVIARGLPSDTGLLLWIDADDVAPQLVRVTTLHDRASMITKAGDGVLELAPGELLEVLERRGPAARIRTRDEPALTGWIDATALGTTWESKPFTLRLDALIKAGTTIAVRPGGPALHRLAPMVTGKHDAFVIAKRGAWLEVEVVEVCRPMVRVRGFVRASTTEIVGPMGGGSSCGRGSGSGVPSWGELANAAPERFAANTELQSADAKLVGRMRSDGELRRGQDGVLRIVTRWGLLPVHAKP
jgi:hypothetical protein